MSSTALDQFIADSTALARAHPEPADCVAAIAPLMQGPLAHADSLLAPRHLRADPDPDHIHLTGVDADRPQAVSLHLYGRNMNSFHLYDVAAGTRRKVNLEHNES